MNVSELFDLTYWISKEIQQANIVQKYQQLQSILQRNSQPNQQQQPFETQKEELIVALKSVPLNQLTKDQLTFLEHLGIANAVSDAGINTVEDILYKNVIDIATSFKKLQEISQGISNGINKSEQIKSGLTDCVFEEDYEANNEILMRISFTGNASMSNISDLKNWGNIWYDVGRGISMAHGASPEEVKIVGATKGSIIIELAVVASIATTASGIILAALKVTEKVLDIKKKAEELRGLKLKNEKIVKELEKEAENEKKGGIEQIANNIINELKIKADSEGDKVTALNKAVKNLVNFIQEGGEVDFIIPDDDKDTEDSEKKDGNNQELRIAFEEIRQLENKLKQLEYLSE